MKYVRTPGFLIDLRRLPDDHRKLFVQAVHDVLRPALDVGAHKGAAPWPRALRIHRIAGDYSMTWRCLPSQVVCTRQWLVHDRRRRAGRGGQVTVISRWAAVTHCGHMVPG